MAHFRRDQEITGMSPFQCRRPANLDLDFVILRLHCTKNSCFAPQNSEDALIVCKYSNTVGTENVAVGSEEGRIHIVRTEASSSVKPIHSWQGHKNVIFDLAWLPNLPVLLTASGDQRITAWDVTNSKCISVFQGHKSSVKTVDCHPEGTGVFVSGSRDGNIIMWDTRDRGKENQHFAVNWITRAHATADSVPPKLKRKKSDAFFIYPSCSVSAVLFQDSNTVLSAGASDRCIKVWDMRRPYSAFKKDPLPCHRIAYPGSSTITQGYTCLMLDKCKMRLFASCTDNTIYQFNCSTYSSKLISSYQGHAIDRYYTKLSLSCDGTYLASGSKEDQAYIWKVSEPGMPLASLEGHKANVGVPAWHPADLTRMVTCSDDAQLFQWHVNAPSSDPDNEVIGRAEAIKRAVNIEDTPCAATASISDDDECSIVYTAGEKTPLTDATMQSKCPERPRAGRKGTRRLLFGSPSSARSKRTLFSRTVSTKQEIMFKNYFITKDS